MRRLRDWARSLTRETLALYCAARDPRTPWHAKLVVGLIVAYVLSPVDLIPDFIPVIGYLDELLLAPLALWLALRLVPPEVLAESRARAERTLERPRSIAAAVVIVAIWIALAVLAAWWLADLL